MGPMEFTSSMTVLAEQLERRVGIWSPRDNGRAHESPRYPSVAPYHPSEAYPESPFPERGAEPNAVYAALRQLLAGMGLDKGRFGTSAWNPLGELIRPGETVVLKPNLLRQCHEFNDDWEYVITHGSVIRAVADYVFIALGGRGRIIIADAPQTDSRLDLIAERLGFAELTDFYQRHGMAIESAGRSSISGTTACLLQSAGAPIMAATMMWPKRIVITAAAGMSTSFPGPPWPRTW